MIKRNRYKLKEYLKDDWIVCRFTLGLVLVLFMFLIGYVHSLSVKEELKTHEIPTLAEYKNGGR